MRVRVEIAQPARARGYDVLIGGGIRECVSTLLREVLPHARNVLIITDASVAGLYGFEAQRRLRENGFQAYMEVIPPGEVTKSLPIAESLYERSLDHGLERGDVILSLGGGVVTDLAGFVAATYLRGVAVVHLPTTLLAQVDAAIGGKTGVNLSRGKNLVGAFHQPHAVIADVSTLASLPLRELRSGLAEVVKCAVIAEPELFDLLEGRIDSEGAWLADQDLTCDIISRAVAVKAGIVGRDERESGERAHLNFGHTIGHALEAATGYSAFLHGEAVAIGMVCAARVSEEIGLCASGTADRLRALLQKLGLPTHAGDAEREQVLSKLRYDKKMKDGKVRLVLTRGVGSVTVAPNVPDDVLTACLDEVLA
jgi:3-dehydroquinate synthase